MSSLTEVWGTLRFPAGAIDRWLETETDGGHAIDEYSSEWDELLQDEHEPLTPSATVAAWEDGAEWFVRIVPAGDEVSVRSAFGDDWWCEWLARLGGLARSAAALGAEGVLEIADDGDFVGSLRVAGATEWVKAGRKDEPADQTGREENGAILDEVLSKRS